MGPRRSPTAVASGGLSARRLARLDAHVLLGDGWLGRTFVAYGLSNFLWWYNDAGSNDTGVLEITLRGATVARTRFVPAYIDRQTGQPEPVTGPEADRIGRKYAALRGCTGLASSPRR